jgi:hypothetical protein
MDDYDNAQSGKVVGVGEPEDEYEGEATTAAPVNPSTSKAPPKKRPGKPIPYKKGDVVVFPKHAGYKFMHNGKEHRVLHHREVKAKIS